ncbi:hypothetical protein [Crenobacter cavernae]|uniref:Energy-coupling factor transporter transmembrane protein EcfT n=1 Tax=Crenobacter cavernae TaxID=2290923 RepID=A0A345Y7F0_9NEIS|nr:hypothetical protein [Crenobacter cavernae]AXK39852.1 hypothetical protein DWG20_10590 [Crenobacter cavernae]
MPDGFHPAVAILIWLAGAIALQALPLSLLLPFAAVAVLALTRLERRAVLVSLRRMRWLLLALAAVMGWTLPGQALWDAPWAPTREGLAEGGAHALRLLILVWWMRILWLTRSRDRLLSGLAGLFSPLAALGVPVERAALRLWLTLHYADAMLASPPGFSIARWRALCLDDMAKAGPDTVELQFCRWRARDVGAVLAAGLAMGWVVKVWA